RRALTGPRLLPMALLALISLAVGSASCGKKTRDQYLAAGDQYVKGGQYQEATIEYRNAVARDPQSGISRMKLADTYMRLNDLGSAAEHYAEAAELSHDDLAPQLKLVSIMLQVRQYEVARKTTDQMLEKHPGNA